MEQTAKKYLLKSMVKKNILRVFIIMSVFALFQIINTMILARTLSKTDMGIFRMVLILGEFISMLGLFGMDASLLRFFSSENITGYNWKTYSFATLTICGLVSSLIVAGASVFYRLSLWMTMIVVSIVIFRIINRLFSSVLRSQKHYEYGAFLERSNTVIFFILVIFIMFANHLNLENSILCYVISMALTIIFVLHITFDKVSIGVKKLPAYLPKEGILFFGILIMTIIMMNASQLFAAKMLSYKDLAVYAVIASVMRIFELSVNALYYVFVPHLNNNKPINTGKIVFFLLSIASAISVFYILFAEPLIHILFKGKYDDGIVLIPYFIGIGIFRILYVLPASIVGGRAERSAIKTFFYYNSIAAVICLFLNYMFILKWQLKGVVFSCMCTWAVAVFLSFISVRSYLFAGKANQV